MRYEMDEQGESGLRRKAKKSGIVSQRLSVLFGKINNDISRDFNKGTAKRIIEEEFKLETKSRYEVIAELEKNKRELIREKESFKDVIRNKERDIRDLDRELTDAKEALEDYKSRVEERKETINELIKSLDESLARFSKLQAKGPN